MMYLWIFMATDKRYIYRWYDMICCVNRSLRKRAGLFLEGKTANVKIMLWGLGQCLFNLWKESRMRGKRERQSLILGNADKIKHRKITCHINKFELTIIVLCWYELNSYYNRVVSLISSSRYIHAFFHFQNKDTALRISTGGCLYCIIISVLASIQYAFRHYRS